MAHAKLHVICGNCGSNEYLTFKIDLEGHDISSDETEYEPAVFISCKNCSTLHDLDDTVPMERKKQD